MPGTCANSTSSADALPESAHGSRRACFLRSLRRGNQFEQLLRIVEPPFKLILVGSKRGGGKLRGHIGVFQAGIGGDKTDFIDSDAVHPGEPRLQLLRQFRGLRFPGGKGAREARQLFLSDRRKKLNACQARCGEQLGKLFFRRRAFERNSIQQELRARRSEQESCVRSLQNGGLQLLPGSLKLLHSATVLVAVEAGELQQNIEAAHERAARRRLWIRPHPAPAASRMERPC